MRRKLWRVIVSNFDAAVKLSLPQVLLQWRESERARERERERERKRERIIDVMMIRKRE